ncbi:MAG: hypothetical protein WD941_06925, partial [Opitutus sp.]
SRLPWQMQQEWSGETGPGARTGSGDAVSMLVNYCHLLGHSTDRIRPYLGVIAGSTQISGRIQTRLSGIGHAGSPGGRGTTYGGVVGMSVALGRLVSLNLGYRLLQTTGVDYGTRWLDEPAAPGSEPAPRSRFDDFKSHVALLGLTIRL